MKQWLLLSILGTLLVAGCGRPQEEERRDPDLIKTLSYSKDVVGQWTGPCAASLDRNLGAKSLRVQLIFSQSDYDEKTQTYNFHNFLELHSAFESADCSGEPTYFLKKSGTYTVLDDRGTDLRKINLARHGTELTPNVGTFVDHLNDAEVCGIKDWMIGFSRSVAAKSCWGIVPYPNMTRYDVFQLLEDDKKLCFGKDDPVNNGTKPSLRPTMIGPCFDVVPTEVN